MIRGVLMVLLMAGAPYPFSAGAQDDDDQSVGGFFERREARRSGLDRIRAFSQRTGADQNEMLQVLVVENRIEGCGYVTHSLVQGYDEKGTVFITVRCDRSLDFSIWIDSTGSVKVHSCEYTETATGNACWRPI